jgi:hypothetical protein
MSTADPSSYGMRADVSVDIDIDIDIEMGAAEDCEGSG